MLIATSLIRFLSYNEVDTPRYAATGGSKRIIFVDMFWQDKTLYIEWEIRLCSVCNVQINRVEESYVLEKVHSCCPFVPIRLFFGKSTLP